LSSLRSITLFSSILVISLAVGCTLTPINSPTIYPSPEYRFQQVETPVPTVPASQPTPLFASPVATSVILTPIPTTIPGGETAERTENVVEALINRLLIPIWNFVYTFVTGAITSLWEFAGLRGGFMAQTIFCLIPGLVVILGVMWRIFRRAR
jgi:hypothetical protein